MRDLIKELKENKRPFGLMDKELQDKAREIGRVDNFEFWNKYEWQLIYGDGCDFILDTTYRLRSDYQEEPEFVECEVYKNMERGSIVNCRMFKTGHADDKGWYVSEAVDHPDFVRFKFEDGKIRNTPDKTQIQFAAGQWRNSVFATLDDFKSGTGKVIHATHVVLKRKGV